MGVHGWAAKRDKNEGEIVAAYEAEGCVVQKLSVPGVCDLLVASPEPERRTFLSEVKMPGKELTKAQKKFHAMWPGEKHIVSSVEEAKRTIYR